MSTKQDDYEQLRHKLEQKLSPDDVAAEEYKLAVLSLHDTEANLQGLQRNVHHLFHGLIVALVLAGVFAGFFAYYLGSYRQITSPETIEQVPSKG